MNRINRQHHQRNNRYWLIAAALVGFCLLWAGCGNDDVSPDYTIIKGVALKGPIWGAEVKAYAIRDGVYQEEPLSRAVTAENGDFTLTLGAYRGPVLIEVSGGNYVDEHTLNWKPLLFPLRAALVNASGLMTLSVNYLTECAVDYAMSAPHGLTPERITAANKQVSLLVGGNGDVDLITTRMPQNPMKHLSTGDPIVRNYTALIGASAFIAEDADLSSFPAQRQALAAALSAFADSPHNQLGLNTSEAANLTAHFSNAHYPALAGTGVDAYTFTLLQTTDLHNRASGYGIHADYTPMTTHDDQVLGGYARIAAKIEETRKDRQQQQIPLILIDSGDFLMGTVYDMTVEDPIALRFFEMMKYDVVTLGNHEFDYSSLGLGMILNNGIKSGFSVPIVATNMVLDGKVGTDDDALEAMKAAGRIRGCLVRQLPNGLKLGFIGLMGKTADEYAPAAPPVTFNHDTAFVQAQVDYLKHKLGVDLVIALSHSGIQDPNGTPKGDDIDLAERVSGIDIIASGHDHAPTRTVIQRNGSHIICAGSYGTNLARLDITYRQSTQAFEQMQLTNIPINDEFKGSAWVQTVVNTVDSMLDQGLKALDSSLSVKGTLATSGTDNLGEPHGAKESGLGNLTADGARYLLRLPVSLGVLTTPTVGLMSNGVIRGEFGLNQKISFADVFSVLPLGITPATDQDPILPGYPMMLVYVSGKELRNICQFTAYIIAAEDEEFKNILAQGSDADKMLLFILNQINSTYYMSISGVKWRHSGASGGYQVTNVELYAPDDYQCLGETTPLNDDAYYPCVVDIYSLMMLNSNTLQMGLAIMNIPIAPKYNLNQANFIQPELSLIKTTEDLLRARIDGDPDVLGGAPGVQEVKEWQTLLLYLITPESNGGLGGVIRNDHYGVYMMGRVMSDD